MANNKFHFGREKPSYKIGNKEIKFESSSEEKPTISFSFSLISLKKHILCFNNSEIEKEYFVEIIEYLSCLSTLTMEQLTDTENKDYHFHHVDLSKKYELKPILFKIFKTDTEIDIPEICYFKASFTDNEKTGIAPRFVGYFEDKSVFKLLFLDFFHAIYPNSNCRKRKDEWIKAYYEAYQID